jgi:hypothetical protein
MQSQNEMISMLENRWSSLGMVGNMKERKEERNGKMNKQTNT